MSKKLDFDLEVLSLQVVENITDILDEFNIKYENFENRISMCCPIHGGDNPTACNIYLQDVGNWNCYTHHCHEDYSSSLLSFIHAFLDTENETSFFDAIEWAANFVGMKATDIQKVEKNKTATKFIQLYKHISKKPNIVSHFYPKHLATQYLQIPSPYFINRGYSSEILKFFDIGECVNPEKSMYNRSVVPCYDENKEFAVGFSGRSIFEKCEKCKFYHNPNTPCPKSKQEKAKCIKWKHNIGFNAESYLYNLWNLDKSLNWVIIVEGPGDVWKLEDAGVKNSLAVFGTKFSGPQKIILEYLPITRLYTAMDNDDAGQKKNKSIMESCNRLFKIKEVIPDKTDSHNDWGNMSTDRIQEIFHKEGLV